MLFTINQENLTIIYKNFGIQDKLDFTAVLIRYFVTDE